jgi:hypothetical protein
MKRFPKANNSHMVRNPKPLQTVLKNPHKLSIPVAFGNLFMWLPFGNSFMTALAAYDKISRITKDFYEKKHVEILFKL